MCLGCLLGTLPSAGGSVFPQDGSCLLLTFTSPREPLTSTAPVLTGSRVSPVLTLKRSKKGR